MTRRTDDTISRAISAGGYCNAYETENYDRALAKLTRRSETYRAAFTLGFFGSYTASEMGSHLEAVQEAWQLVGKRAQELGLAVDEPVDFGDEHSDHEYHTRSSYGVMPDRDRFRRAFEARCPDGTFSVGNDPYYGNETFSESELWDALQEQLATWEAGEHAPECPGDGSCNGDGCPCEDAGSWCSCVLGVLGFEWI